MGSLRFRRNAATCAERTLLEPGARRALCRTDAREESRFHGGYGVDAGAQHRSDKRDHQHDSRRSVTSAPLPRCESTGPSLHEQSQDFTNACWWVCAPRREWAPLAQVPTCPGRGGTITLDLGYKAKRLRPATSSMHGIMWQRLGTSARSEFP